MLVLSVILSALLLQTTAMATEPPRFEERPGDVYEMRRESESRSTGENGSSGSSSSRNLIVERVVAVHGADLELEFDLPPETSPEDRAREWFFPVRVLRRAGGALELLNRPELETRLQAWLKAAGLSQAQCGRWYFTWNAFKIECDPLAVLPTLTAYDLRVRDLADGAPYVAEGAVGTARLREDTASPAGATFVTELAIDSEAVRRQRAEADIIVAEI